MKHFLTVSLLYLCLFGAHAQEKERSDSLVRLLSATRMEQVEKGGENYRKVTGPASFLHNGTYLLCDTALWNMNTSVIDCIGHVSIIQEDTRLDSDKLVYLIDENLAQFRGSLVELEDREGNRLRTRHLDYNTKDSVAVFMHGGSMMDHDGQIIESVTGRYDSKIKLFTFLKDVNMFTDSVFIRTPRLLYHSDSDLAEFSGGIDAWHEEDMLSSEDGWYDRPRDLFFFRKKVHAQNRTQEAWGDSLFFSRSVMEVELLGNAQVTDTTRNMHSMADRMFYQDTLSTLTLSRDPVVVGVFSEKEKPDSVWIRGEKFILRSVPMCDVPASETTASEKRLKDLATDAISEYRKKTAEEAARKAAEAAKLDPNNPASRQAPAAPPKAAPKKEPKKEPAPVIPAAPADSTALADSSASAVPVTPADTASAVVPVDSTKRTFLSAIRDVRVFRRDMQIVTDSLEYNDLDSLIRLYKRPLVWNQTYHQYTSDSLFAVVRGKSLEKASLMSDAFVTVHEDSLCFDQIRSTEMVAFFDSTGVISRFDALGDADAVFYIKEDSTFATVNISKSKMLSAAFKEGEIDKVYYYDASKSDAYPLAQMKKEQRTLKGFEWQPERRPRSPRDITTRKLRPSERLSYASRVQPPFVFTGDYFPGYIAGVREEIVHNREARERRKREKAARDAFLQDSLAKAAIIRDSLAKADSLHAADSLKAAADSLKKAASDSLNAAADSLSKAASDSLRAGADSLSAAPLTPAQIKALEKEAKRKEKEARRKEREALARAKAEAREREWARLDSLDAEKAARKAAVKKAKEREKKRKAYKALLEQERREKEVLDRYIEYFRRKKAAAEAKAAAREASIPRRSVRQEEENAAEGRGE